VLRGPGRWLPVHQREAFEREAPKGSGRALDFSTLQGKCVLFVWTAVTMSIGIGLFRSQPYLSLLTFMATVIAWPLLLTGRASELPLAFRNRTRQKLEGLYRRLSQDHGLRVHPIGRFGDGDGAPDEIRLKISAATLPSGTLGLEIAACGVGDLIQPCLLVRVREGSEAHRCFQSLGAFTRGRTPEERVAIVAPTLASSTRIVALVRRMLEVQSSRADYGMLPPRARNNSDKSSGSGSATSKPGKSSHPDQATRAA
jgi:hypothetical protein